MIFAMLACGAQPTPAPAPAPAPAARDARCLAVGSPSELGRVVNPALTEASGLVASRRHGGFWAHNDSGDGPRLFRLGPDGADGGTVDLAGAEAVDWEDLAWAPGEAHDWLIAADIGDNKHKRASVQLYRIPEPPPGATGPVAAERMVVRYPKGPANAEALVVDPRSGELFAITKVDEGPSVLYSLGTWVSGEVAAREVGAHAFPTGKGSAKVTGADVSPDGRWLAVRTYTQVHLFPVDGSLAAAFGQRPCDVATPEEPQGEAVAFVEGGLALVSEASLPPIWRIPLDFAGTTGP